MKHRHRRILLGGLVAVALTTAVSAGSTAASSASTSGGSIEIAIFHTYSGANAAYGPEAAAGCFPAERLINAAGGILGHQLHLHPGRFQGRSCRRGPRGQPADRVVELTRRRVGRRL